VIFFVGGVGWGSVSGLLRGKYLPATGRLPRIVAQISWENSGDLLREKIDGKHLFMSHVRGNVGERAVRKFNRGNARMRALLLVKPVFLRRLKRQNTPWVEEFSCREGIIRF